MKTLTSGRTSAPAGPAMSAPSRRTRFASPGSIPTSSRWPPSSASTSTSTRATFVPKRTSSRSFDVRHDRAVQPK